MTTKMRYAILILATALLTASCSRQAKRMQEARALYEQGAEYRSHKLTEAAAESLLQALSVLEQCDSTDERILLQGQATDMLGAIYNKHGLFEEALAMHHEAARCYSLANDMTGLMTAKRNAGRAAYSLEQYDVVKQCYDSALLIAATLNDDAMTSDLYLGLGRDYYMPTEQYAEAIASVERAMQGGLDDNNTDIAHMTLGILHYYTHDYDTAKTHLNAALRSERPGLRMSVYQTLYAIAYNEGDYTQAVDYQDLFAENMMLSDKEHDSEALQSLKAENDLKAQKISMESRLRNRSLKLYLVVALAVIVLLVVVMIVRKKVSDHRIAVEQFRDQTERDQKRIRELVGEMENLIRTNDELLHDQQTLTEKERLMTQQIMKHNPVYATAQALSEQVTAESLSFTLTDGDWDEFISLTDLAFDGFSERLLKLYPKLGRWDVRICCLSKNGFSNQVISILLDTQTDSYYKRKTRIKQTKMNLGSDDRSFEEIINNI